MSQCILVGTPIGNLKDITLRAVETLQTADVIACEDTRVTKVLLDAYNIKKPLLACHKFNEAEAAAQILMLLQDGKTVAVVSDAGMPGISDPGAVLVKKLREMGADVGIVPGVTAVATAVALAGVPTGFTFVGFLPDKKKDKEDLLKNLKYHPYPLVFYVPPHDLAQTYRNLLEGFGDRKLTVVKELTKIYETVAVGTLSEPPEVVEKGEFVMIVMPEEKTDGIPPREKLQTLIAAGMDKKEAVKTVAQEYGLLKNDVYQWIFNN